MANNRNRTHAISICWFCENAVPNRDGTRGCSWSKAFKPVEGWDAEKTVLFTGYWNSKRFGTDSYIVKSCPEFIGDSVVPKYKEKEEVAQMPEFPDKPQVIQEARYINADKLIELLPILEQDEEVSLMEAVEDFRFMIHSMPDADVKPVVHGYWITSQTAKRGGFQLFCSACHNSSGLHTKKNYCPNCGARMDMEG